MDKSFEYWTKKELLSLPMRKWDENIGEFDRLIILPANTIHDSGFRNMEFVAVNGNKPFCRLGGCSDVIHIGGCGGYAKESKLPDGWRIDCLKKSGLLSLFATHKITAGRDLSSFEIFSTAP